MNRFVVNPGTENAWEILLQPGVNFFGRGDDNHFAIEHPSISSKHCQVAVTDSDVVIKDLGSINGTFVDETMVDETPLANGQIIRLGDVTLQFETDQIPAVKSVPGTVAPPATAAMFCKIHPKAVAHFVCPKCQRTFCDICVSSRQGKKFCRACSVECAPLEHASAQSEPDESFLTLARGAFMYPLKGDGLILLIAGGIFLMIIDAAKFIVKYGFIYGLVAFIFLTVFGTGYLTAYLRRILTDSAIGENKMPDWPDITDFGGDIASPFFQLLGTVIFCFSPAIAVTIYAMSASEGGPWLGSITTASILFGCIYFPMAFMAVAMFDSVAAVNPLLIIPSILKIPKEYALTIILFVAILVVRWLGETILPEILPVPVLPSIFASLFSLYLLAVEMRILGLLYWTNKGELGWFNR
jgi:FHA domain-containing protein